MERPCDGVLARVVETGEHDGEALLVARGVLGSEDLDDLRVAKAEKGGSACASQSESKSLRGRTRTKRGCLHRSSVGDEAQYRRCRR